MGIGVALLFHIILYFILLVTFLAGGWLIQKLFGVTGRKAILLLRLLPFGAAALPLLLFVSLILWANFAPPSAAYAMVFNGGKSGKIANLHGFSHGSNDFGEVLLAFDVNGAGFDDIRSEHVFRRTRAFDFDPLPLSTDTAPPEWWVGTHCPARLFYVAEHIGRWDKIAMIRCPHSGRTFVQAVWIE